MRSSGVKEALLSFFSCSSYAWEIPVSCDIYCHAFWKQPKLEWTFFLMVDFCWGLVVCICSTWIEDFTEKCNEAGDVDLWMKYRTLKNVQLIINFTMHTCFYRNFVLSLKISTAVLWSWYIKGHCNGHSFILSTQSYLFLYYKEMANY